MGKVLHSLFKNWVLLLCAGIFLVLLANTLRTSYKYNSNQLIYATDDNYIHFSMAENFVRYGHWSVDNKNFTSSSSSPLWMILLSSSMLVIGINKYIPLGLNLIFALLVICFSYYCFVKYKTGKVLTLAGLSAIIFFTPLISLVLTGQEHIMHIFLTLVYVYLLVRILCEGSSSALFIILTPLIVLARYEGLFLVFAAAVLLAFNKKFKLGCLIIFLGVLPVVVYGIISVLNGWYFLPNSILLKGQVPDLNSFSGIVSFLLQGIKQLVANPSIMCLLISSILIFILSVTDKRSFWIDYKIMLLVFFSVSLMHMQFARTGSFYRYESYLVCLGIFVIVISLREFIPDEFSFGKFRKQILPTAAISVSIILFCIPLINRAENSLLITARASNNIYEQQYQMGLFLNKYYRGQTIAANDIGVINYLADIECVDLAGLASIEVAELMKTKTLSRDKIYNLCNEKHVAIAIVYDHWFIAYGGLPPQWKKIGEWTIRQNVIVAGSTVSFYAVSPEESEKLTADLKEFSSLLPKDIIQSGSYLDSDQLKTH